MDLVTHFFTEGGNNMFKKVISSMLTLVLTLCMFSVIPVCTQANAQEFVPEGEIYSGTFGADLTWEYDENTCTLTISGTGDMGWYMEDDCPMPWYSYRHKIKTVVIGEGAKNIGGGAFRGCTSLEGVTIPGSVTCIEEHAFDSCENLKSLIIPEGVTSIGYSAFYSCLRLTGVVIPDSVTNIANNAFDLCVSLESLAIGSSVTTIGENAFKGCGGLKNITIPDSVTSIGNYAFRVCSGITNITIPRNLTDIGYGAFAYCFNLENITVEDDNSNYSSQDGILFNKDKTELICYPTAKSDTEYTIPNSVTEIEKYAFAGCQNLENAIIPGSVTDIKEGAFSTCENLKSVTIPSSVTSIGEQAFEWCDKLTIYGSKGSCAQRYANENNINFVCIESGTDATLGDANNDGDITMVDVVFMQREIANLIKLTESQTGAADVNTDGKVTMEDVVLVQKFIAGLINKF